MIVPLDIAFDERGLAPCIVQDCRTGAVLTLAWMNAESLRRTLETGQTWFFSRSRDELWNKGATSGHTQRVVELRYDCDADTLLALVDPAGPACHTGQTTCFYRAVASDGGSETTTEVAAHSASESTTEVAAGSDAEPATTQPQTMPFEALGDLQQTLNERRESMPTGSYTSELLNNPELIGEKVQEEAEEVVRAAREESDDRVANEAADVLYHLGVLLTSRKLEFSDAFDVLNERRPAAPAK